MSVEAADVVTRDDLLAPLVLLAQAVDELRAEDVDLPVEDPPLVGDVDLFLGERLDEVLQLLVGKRAEVGEGVHGKWSFLLGSGAAAVYRRQRELESCSTAVRA